MRALPGQARGGRARVGVVSGQDASLETLSAAFYRIRSSQFERAATWLLRPNHCCARLLGWLLPRSLIVAAREPWPPP
jgi:hypothetical protein